MYTITYIEYSFVTVRAFLKYGRFDGFSFRVGSRYIWSVDVALRVPEGDLVDMDIFKTGLYGFVMKN